MSSTTPSKIRDSCHACAVSKVRCPKERPACSRCEKRGIECAYFVTKRPGRKREKPRDPPESLPTDEGNGESFKQSDPPAVAEMLAQRSQAVSGAELSTPCPISPPASIAAGSAHFSDDFSCFVDAFADNGSHLDLMGLPKLSAMNSRFTELLSEPFDTIDADSLRLDMTDFQQDHGDIADLLTSNEVNPALSGFGPPFLSSGLCTPASHEQIHSATISGHTSNSSEAGFACGCMVRALNLLNRLFAAESPSNGSLSGGGRCSTPVSGAGTLGGNISTLNVVAQNKEAIEIVSNMLQCSCSETGYLTTILSIIVFKILEWYTAAVRQIPMSMTFDLSESMFGSNWRSQTANEPIQKFRGDSSSSEDDSSGRTTTQLILGELHHVQRLLNLLAQRLNAHGKRHDLQQVMEASSESHISSPLLSEHGRRTETFSPSTLGQIEIDLRKSLTALSSEIITMLRQS